LRSSHRHSLIRMARSGKKWWTVYRPHWQSEWCCTWLCSVGWICTELHRLFGSVTRKNRVYVCLYVCMHAQWTFPQNTRLYFHDDDEDDDDSYNDNEDDDDSYDSDDDFVVVLKMMRMRALVMLMTTVMILSCLLILIHWVRNLLTLLQVSIITYIFNQV
jgi:hypothetical protein